MKGTMSAATVHKQYNEVVSAFRRLIADPALRARFDGEADGYFRRCALGVWQADNASSITPRHVEFYNAIYTNGSSAPSALYWEVATGVAGFDQFQPPAFFDRLREYDRLTHSRLSRTFIDQLTLLLLLFAAVDDVVSEPEAGFVNACSDLLLALCGGLEGDRPALKADEFVTRPRTSAPPEEEPAPAEEPEGVTVTDASGYYRMTFCPGNLVYYYMDDYWNFWFQGTGEAELYPLLLEQTA